MLPDASYSAPMAAKQVGQVNWTAYAQSYDMLLDHNPAYRDLLDYLRKFLSAETCPECSRILDAGAGTGNFSMVVREVLPNAELTLVEPDHGMRTHAKDKLGQGIRIAPVAFQDFESSEAFDLIVCTHALYTMPDPHDRLRQMHNLVRPGGTLFLIDFGMQMRVWDWRIYLIGCLLRDRGLIKTAKVLWAGREVARQNTLVAQRQKAGDFWLHTPEKLRESLMETGWLVQELRPVYRDYSTLAIARKR